MLLSQWLSFPTPVTTSSCEACNTEAAISMMPEKMNLDYLKLLYCEFQKYKVMTMSVVGGQPKKHANLSYKATKHIEHTF